MRDATVECSIVLLGGERFQSMTLRVLASEDSGWKRVRADADVDGFRAYVWDHLRVEQLATFCSEIKGMYSSLSGNASLHSEDGFFEIDAAMDSLGHIEWTVEMRSSRWRGPRLSFELRADQTYLPDVINQVEDALTH
jgi:hypothetical protein